MKRWWILGLGLLAGLAWAEPALQNGDLVAICGDSITEQKQYSVFIEDYLLMCQPAAGLRANQFGWSGETSWGFKGRMANDVLPFKPNVATTCYGMNDGGYSPMTDDKAKRYRDYQAQIVQDFKAGGVRTIVVGSPGAVDTDTFRGNPELAVMYNQTLAAERDIAKQVAEAEGVLYADVYDPMYDAMAPAKEKYGHEYHVAGRDGVHPSANGHLIMAYAFLKALGCSGDIGTIAIDLAMGQATGTDGHKVISSANGKVELESTRYPFCFYGDPSSPNSTRGILEFVPFNQDLNRLVLKVTDATAERYTVTWGDASKDFAAADLAQGINLAAEFLDNPFSEPFSAVEKKIRDQQNQETPAIKQALNGLIGFRRLLPDEGQTFDRLAGKVVDKLRAACDAVPAEVVPVRHTISIAPLP